jgi:hypothetical protein
MVDVLERHWRLLAVTTMTAPGATASKEAISVNRPPGVPRRSRRS